MKYFSMFSGIGGFESGIGDKATCIGYSEIDKYAIQIYEKHFKHKNYGDATKLDTKQLPDFDLLVGGFPCQAFSIAGKRKGFDDTRGTLFFEIARVLADKRPRYFVLENVKGLLSHDCGKTFQAILGVLTDLGYFVEWQVLNSKNHGVPQNRERVFFVGHLGGGCGRKVFPVGEDSESDIVLPTLTARYWGGQANGSYLREITKEINVVGSLNSDGWEKRHEQIRRVHGIDGIAPTIPTGTGGGVMTKIMKKAQIRRLTPTECERLQGFEDGWTEGVSDTQRYRQLGNAVTTNVIKAIMERLL